MPVNKNKGITTINGNPGLIPPHLVYADLNQIASLYGAVAVRIQEDLSIEVLVRNQDGDADVGEYQWYDVTELDTISGGPGLTVVN